MARDTILRCDAPTCDKTDGVQTVVIGLGKKTIEVDLCEEDRTYYLSELKSVSRRSTRASVRPRSGFKKTTVSAANL